MAGTIQFYQKRRPRLIPGRPRPGRVTRPRRFAFPPTILDYVVITGDLDTPAAFLFTGYLAIGLYRY